MVRQGLKFCLIGALVVAATVAVLPVDSAVAEEGSRAAWLMGRAQLEDMALTGQRFEQSEFGSKP
ncbi:MAG: hypothetical protein QNL91_13495, partial [Candidatus Krumholzibacteria bacterium]|nr:hypothetical protein [Candidatus Krumholzibacteria bacterium]